MEKVSLVVTVKNEECSILELLESISASTRLPDELICVDGGSTDKTVGKIGLYGQTHATFPIRILLRKGNIAVGRNAGIKAAKHKIIAITDAGCTVDKHWFERLTGPFSNKKIDVVAGFYTPTGESILQKCMGIYTSTMPDVLDPETFLPSSRSIAFKKSAWKKVGGYPDDLDTAEDLMFARALKQADMKFITVEDAIVLWPQRSTWKSAFLQFFRYARGDGKAAYFRPQTPFLVLRCFLGLAIFLYALYYPNPGLQILALYIGVYYIFSVTKNWRYMPEWRSLYYLPAVQLVSDIAVISGMIVGTIQRYDI